MAYWWEPRRPDERTADYLGRVLDALGEPFATVARKARACHYDDFFCPEAVDDGANIHRLVFAIEHRIDRPDVDPALRERAGVVVAAAKTGEFDGTKAEAQEWAQTPDGQATFALLDKTMTAAAAGELAARLRLLPKPPR